MEDKGKGQHLFKIKKTIEDWPWSYQKERTVETALAKLRIGHVGLKKHLNRFHMSESDECECGSVESIEHFFLQCPLYATFRNDLYSLCCSLGVDLSLRNILGGSNLPENKQNIILNGTITFIKKSNKLSKL